jgi:hypothetical protein
MATRRVLAEIVVETDDAVYFGPRQVEACGNTLHGLGWNVAKLLLHAVQYGQQRTWLARVAGNDAVDGWQPLMINLGH